MSADIGQRRHPIMYPEVTDPRSTVERIMVLVMVRSMFDDDAGVCEQIVKLCALCSQHDEDVLRIRNLAAGGQIGIVDGSGFSADEAIRAIRIICQNRLRPTN